jgi:hypothetical protein
MEYGGSFGEGGRKKSECVRKGKGIRILLIWHDLKDRYDFDQSLCQLSNYIFFKDISMKVYREEIGNISKRPIGTKKISCLIWAFLANENFLLLSPTYFRTRQILI